VEILVINFSLEGMTESEYRNLCDEVAPAFAAVPGLVSKVWLADRPNGVYGGVYTFETGAALDAYLASDLLAQVAANPALVDITVRRFEVLSDPTAITHGLASATA
jgi:Putative mono-oxygenase ydhR